MKIYDEKKVSQERDQPIDSIFTDSRHTHMCQRFLISSSTDQERIVYRIAISSPEVASAKAMWTCFRNGLGMPLKNYIKI